MKYFVIAAAIIWCLVAVMAFALCRARSIPAPKPPTRKDTHD